MTHRKFYYFNSYVNICMHGMQTKGEMCSTFHQIEDKWGMKVTNRRECHDGENAQTNANQVML